MTTRTKQLLLVILIGIGYLSLGLLGETGKIVSGLIGSFAVGWLVIDVAKAIVKD